MNTLPQTFQWTPNGFEPIVPLNDTDILVADSWRVHDGEVWGLQDHLQRFMAGIATQTQFVGPLPNIDPAEFETAIREILQHTAQSHPGIDFFPRISVEAKGRDRRVILFIRPAPPVRTTTTLLVPDYTDPRTRPTVKGPDIDLMRRLVAEATTDDVVLHDGTNVIETTTGALLVWHTPKHLVLCQASQQLASISVQRIANHARSRNISVTSRPVTIEEMVTGEYPVWFSNTLHGISPVSAIRVATEEISVASYPETAAWQSAWWRGFES